MPKKKQTIKLCPLLINEVLYLSKLAKLYGEVSENIPSYRGATFNSVKLKGDNNEENIKAIIQLFKNRYNKTLTYECNKIGNKTIGYLSIISK